MITLKQHPHVTDQAMMQQKSKIIPIMNRKAIKMANQGRMRSAQIVPRKQTSSAPRSAPVQTIKNFHQNQAGNDPA